MSIIYYKTRLTAAQGPYKPERSQQLPLAPAGPVFGAAARTKPHRGMGHPLLHTSSLLTNVTHGTAKSSVLAGSPTEGTCFAAASTL